MPFIFVKGEDDLKAEIQESMNELWKSLEWEEVGVALHHDRNRFYSYAETLRDQHTTIWAPVLDSVKAHTEHYLTDVLHDYDAMRRTMEEITETVTEARPAYMIGVRHSGTDHPAYIHSVHTSRDLTGTYADLFCFEVGVMEKYDHLQHYIKVLRCRNPFAKKGSCSRKSMRPWPVYLKYLRDFSEASIPAECEGASPMGYVTWREKWEKQHKR